MKNFWFIFLVLLGCTREPLHSPKGATVGTIDGEQITAPQVDYAAGQLRIEVSPTNLPKLLDHMVAVSVCAQEAVRQGMLKDEKVVSGLAWMERMFLAQELLNRLTETLAPSLSEIAAYFSEHRDQFTWGLKLNLMVLPDSVLAEQTLNELKSGANFTQLARERSLDTSVINLPGYPTRGIGMSLGWSLADEEAVFDLAPGALSKVISTPVGYQLVKVVDKKRITDSPSLNEITQFYISEALKAQKRQLVMNRLLDSLRQGKKIVLKPEAYQKRQ